ncbi:MAG: hypothetical protein K8I04_03815 [Gammaproteobacteria bacterium]|nr:hypothetical protein [Gammaproteobacteria bacterium]
MDKVSKQIRSDPSNFFIALAGSKPSENYLSRAFHACFTQSPAFANTILSLIWKSRGMRGDVPDYKNWVCDYQPVTPLNKTIRPDLCLQPTQGTKRTGASKPIFIESKVGAVLGEDQLKNYIDSGTEVLVAITKNWPEISRARLSQLGVNHLRWQDVSRAVSEVSSRRSSKDRFLCDAFVDLLEDMGMSYRENITVPQLEQVGMFLSKVSAHGQKRRNYALKSCFEIADSCVSLLQDARRIAQESMPVLSKCNNWGPGYFALVCDEEPSSTEWHAIGIEMWKSYSRSRLLCAIYFSASKPSEIYWEIENIGSEIKDDRKHISVPIKKLTTNGELDSHKIAGSILEAVKKWNPF